MIQKTCNYYHVSLNKGYYAVPVKEAWFIYFAKKEFATITCPFERQSKMVELQGFAKLEAPCSLSIPGVTFHTVQTVTFDMSKQPAVQIPLMSLDVTARFAVKHKTRLIEQIDKDLLEMKTSDEKKSMSDLDWSVKVPVGFSTSSLILLLVTIMLLGALMFYLWRKGKRLPWRRNRTQMNIIDGSVREANTWLQSQGSELQELRGKIDKLFRRVPTVDAPELPTNNSHRVPGTPVPERRQPRWRDEPGVEEPIYIAMIDRDHPMKTPELVRKNTTNQSLSDIDEESQL